MGSSNYDELEERTDKAEIEDSEGVLKLRRRPTFIEATNSSKTEASFKTEN